MRRRALYRIVAVLWLCSQAAMIAMAPLPSCRDHGPAWGFHVSGGHADHDCPMHRAQAPKSSAHAGHHGGHEDPRPSMRCRCSASETALASLIMGSGLLTPSFTLPLDIVTGPVTPGTFAAVTFASRLDTPPPRFRSLG